MLFASPRARRFLGVAGSVAAFLTVVTNARAQTPVPTDTAAPAADTAHDGALHLTIHDVGLAIGNARHVEGMSVAGLGVGAGQSLRGIAVAGIGVGAGDNIVGITFAGLGVGAGNRIRGLTVAGIGVGAGSSVEGITIAGIAAGAPRVRGLVASLMAGGQNVKGALLAPAYVRIQRDGSLTGFSLSAFNQVKGTQHGLTLGVFNFAHELHGVQIGLLNYAGNNHGIAKLLPFVNAHH